MATQPHTPTWLSRARSPRRLLRSPRRLLSGLSLIAVLACTPLLAQPQADSPVARSDIPGGVTIVPDDIIAKGLRATELLQADVYNGRNKQLGHVSELIAVQAGGELRLAIVETGGFLGIGARRLAIPITDFAALDRQLVLPEATEESLSRYPDADSQPIAGLEDIRLSRLLEAGVFNDRNESLGEVHDLVISREGVITVVILDVGGTLGLVAHRVAVPLQQFRGLALRMVLPRATPEILRDLPAYQGRQ